MGVRQGRQGGKVDKGEEEKRGIKTHEDIIIYQKAFDPAMTIFELSKQFPTEERYSLTDQIRRSGALCLCQPCGGVAKKKVSSIICRAY
ncbi:hypothetical protein CYANOKiyG1_07980 [Okeania sp. KiyG1]|nr:hypothetical protein CYANOKiyG1_07980 [Okeania sp. KiyG1]